MSTTGPLLGYNNNIPYKGQVYHVQTEDSGSRRPHVITHLFADGGRIVKTTKTSYADFVGSENLSERVRTLMRDQHKRMVISLRDGQLDELLADGAAPLVEELPAAQPDAGAAPAAPLDGSAAPKAPEPPPSAPLELLERAAEDDQEFVNAVQELVPGDSEPPRKSSTSEPSPGSYSFVGRRSGSPDGSKPPLHSEPPPTPRRGSPGTPPTGSPRPRRVGSDRPGTALLGPRAPAISEMSFEDRPTTPFTEQVRAPRGLPDAFGARYVSDRRLDEVVTAFLRRDRDEV